MRHLLPLGALLLIASFSPAADWPAFRGAKGDGISPAKTAPTEWAPDKNIKWKAPLPGPGNGSPIVSGDRVFVLCAENDGRRRSLYCFNRTDGKQQWVKTVEFDKKMPTHKTNPYAGSTPLADGERVLAWHSSVGLYCYDYEGNELWKRDLGEFKHMWGYGASPILHDGKVILYCGPGAEIFITALDVKTGETLWKTVEPQEGDGNKNESNKPMGSWCTPIIAHVDGKEQIICSMPTRVNGYDPLSGKLLWWCEGVRGVRGDLVYSSPIMAGDLCVVTGGYRGPSFAFKPGGQGNITDTARKWRIAENPQSIGSGVYVDGSIYMAYAGPGVLTCFNPKTGKERWRARGEGNHWGSIVAAGDRLYVTAQNGTTLVFKANPEKFEKIATNPLREQSNSTPAIVDGEIFIRTFGHVYRIAE